MKLSFRLFRFKINKPPISPLVLADKTLKLPPRKKDLQRVLDRLYNCRDLEISNLWQRSVFLSVFLILCFTGYGYLALEMLKGKASETVILKYSAAAVCLAAISSIFSIIWILMSKSSKAWYELYEGAISDFETEHHLVIGLPEENIMGNMESREGLNGSIFSTKGGAYSPSKVNVFIGQVSLSLWVVIGIGHTICIFTDLDMKKGICLNIYEIIAIGVLLSTLMLASKIVNGSFLKSTFLK